MFPDFGGFAEIDFQTEMRVQALLEEPLEPNPIDRHRMTLLTTYSMGVQGHPPPIRQRLQMISYRDMLLSEKIVEATQSPWLSNPVMVPNPGGKIRF